MTRGPKPMPAMERILRRSSPGAPDECWPWTGGLNASGYGQIQAGSNYDGTRGPQLVHRVAYVALVGPIPEDRPHLDHTCHNDDESCPGGKACQHRRCWNPAHLEPVTSGENTRRSSKVGGPRLRRKTPA